MSIINYDLISKCKVQDERAMMQIYDLYCQGMYTVACRYLSEEDAKDAMQDGFLKAFSNIDRYNFEFSFGAWLKRIIINTCLDRLKKKQIDFKPLDVESISKVDETSWEFNSEIKKEAILKAIEQLKPKYNIVVKLYLIEGYDHSEISEILNIPIKTSRTHLRRGKQTLQELLKALYNEARY
ncbi:RNA polymerase sigma factor [Psychroserpens sp. XS_ASV72]|uniref:RNA polymerase sigma factor n=1 Tax=Psychroserpens sp. XS_ASV72 TaxID=3241293 RepID=UPI003516C98C